MHRRIALAVTVGAIALVAACQYDPNLDEDAATGDARADSRPPVGFVAHVADDAELGFTSTVDLTISAPITIDTSTGIVSPALPAGVHAEFLRQVPEADGAPDLFVIQARDISIGSAVNVIGGRALVLVATGTITVQARIEAHGQPGTAGPGGSGPAEGAGAGLNGDTGGISSGTNRVDSGGSGGSYGGPGGAGGDGDDGAGGAALLPGPLAGPTWGDPTLPVLFGGSGGGNAAPCGLGGGGGGIVQLSAAVGIVLAATINVGGGGGAGGALCDGQGGSGGGGGAGGAIYLETPELTGAGLLAANGGGGGGGANPSGTTFGTAGADAMAVDGAAPGGVGFNGASGGDGAFGATVGGDGADRENGGGGGGGVGRIFLDVPPEDTVNVRSSPAYQRRM